MLDVRNELTSAPAVEAQYLPSISGWPLLYQEEGAALGVNWPKGILLHGPPGCGKTLVTRSVAAEFNAEVFEISAANVFGAYTGSTCYITVILSILWHWRSANLV